MEIDEDCNSNVFRKPTTSGLNFSSFAKPGTPVSRMNATSYTTMNTPVRSHVRRGSSGIFFNTMMCSSTYFRHLKRLHMESMEGLNIIKQPPARAVFRSSLPATPIATPIYRESFPFFTEQTLLERLCRTPSPRRGAYSRNSQMDTDDHEVQPMDISSPTIDEESSTSGSSPNKDQPTGSDFQESLNSIYYKINDQFNPD